MERPQNIVIGFARLPLIGKVEKAVCDGGVSKDMLNEIFPPKRWAAVIQVLSLRSLEKVVFWSYVYGRQQVNEEPLGTSLAKFMDKYDCPLADTSHQNLRARFQAITYQVYEKERLLTDKSPVVVKINEMRSDG